VENDSYAAFLRRAVRAHGRRIAAGDVDGLVDLVALAFEVEAATRAAVVGLREAGYSWAEIAARLGVTRQAAHQRWGGEQA
jgi:DNA-directed RNA polymerase specialized sigma24 family protein